MAATLLAVTVMVGGAVVWIVAITSLVDLLRSERRRTLSSRPGASAGPPWPDDLV